MACRVFSSKYFTLNECCIEPIPKSPWYLLIPRINIRYTSLDELSFFEACADSLWISTK
eukprot:m.91999 g.91999  ORF g.91999 m.91999 type:complete len:59 (-) comp12971_c0_seq2:182-358(-)